MKRVLPFLIILVAILVFYWPTFFWPAVNITPQVGTNDLTDLFYPIRDFSIRSLKRGILPVWLSGISGGYPILASGGILYPFSFSFLFLPLYLSVNLRILTTYLLLGIAGFFYFRQLKLSQMASLFGALSLTFSGVAVHELMHLETLVTLTFLLFELICWERFFQTKRFSYIPLAGIALGLKLLGGHLQITFYSLFFLGAYLLFLKVLKKMDWWRLIVAFLVFILLGLLIAAVQILPTVESTFASTRAAGLSPESIMRYNFPIKNLKTFLFPYADYDPSHTLEAFHHNGWPAEERYGYVGIIPLFLAGLALFVLFRRRPRIIFFAIALVFFLLLSFGNQTFLGFILLLPPFNFFRLPTQFLVLVDLSLVCLAAFGFGFMEDVMKQRLLGQKRKLFVFCLAGIIFLSFFDLYFWGKKLFPPVPAEDWYQTPEVASFLRENLKSQERITNEHYYYPSVRIFLNQEELWDDSQIFVNLRNLLPAFNNLMYNLPMAVGAANSGGIKIARYNDLEMEIVFGGIKYQDFKIVDFNPWYFPLNRLLGVRYLLLTSKVSKPELELVYETDFKNGQDQVYVYELKETLPRAFVVGKTQVLEPEEIKQKLMDPKFDPKEVLLLEEEVDWGRGEEVRSTKSEVRSAKSEVRSYDGQRVEIEVETDKNAFLVLTDVYYPGWNAYINGEKAEIYQADYAFRAVPVRKGKQKVIFRYQPKSLVWGGILTLTGFLVAIALGLFTFFRERKSSLAKG